MFLSFHFFFFTFAITADLISFEVEKSVLYLFFFSLSFSFLNRLPYSAMLRLYSTRPSVRLSSHLAFNPRVPFESNKPKSLTYATTTTTRLANPVSSLFFCLFLAGMPPDRLCPDRSHRQQLKDHQAKSGACIVQNRMGGSREHLPKGIAVINTELIPVGCIKKKNQENTFLLRARHHFWYSHRLLSFFVRVYPLPRFFNSTFHHPSAE